MTVEHIDELFQKAIKERGVHNKLGVTKDVVYNYRKGRGNLSFGDKLEVLYKLKAIIILMPIRGREDFFLVNSPEQQPMKLPEGFEEIKADWLNHMK